MRWTLSSDRVPEAWFNVVPHLPAPLRPPLHPGTREPIGPDDLAPLFPMALIGQEVTGDPWVEIPAEVRRRAQALATDPARPGRKARAGTRHACAHLLQGRVRVARRFAQTEHRGSPGVLQPPRRNQAPDDRDGRRPMGERSRIRYLAVRHGMQGLHGEGLIRAEAVPQGDDGGLGRRGRTFPGRRPVRVRDHSALRSATLSATLLVATDSHYSLGSVLNHVLLHQTVIGLEAKEQLREAGEELPDLVVGSCGGGSNLGGLSLPFVPDAGVSLLAVEPSSCPTLTAGRLDYDFGDTAGMTPLLSMYTLGHDFIPPPIHAGGLRYHGDAPIISNLVENGRMQATAYPQGKVFEAAVQFARTQGTIPAPETAHAIRAVIDEALAAKERSEEKVILFGYSGHGLLDLGAYDDYLHGRLVDA